MFLWNYWLISHSIDDGMTIWSISSVDWTRMLLLFTFIILRSNRSLCTAGFELYLFLGFVHYSEWSLSLAGLLDLHLDVLWWLLFLMFVLTDGGIDPYFSFINCYLHLLHKVMLHYNITVSLFHLLLLKILHFAGLVIFFNIFWKTGQNLCISIISSSLKINVNVKVGKFINLFLYRCINFCSR